VLLGGVSGSLKRHDCAAESNAAARHAPIPAVDRYLAVLAAIMMMERVTSRGARLAPLVGLALIGVAVTAPLR
jgi:hypothetical protein